MEGRSHHTRLRGGGGSRDPPSSPGTGANGLKSLEKFPPRHLPSVSAPPAPDPTESFPGRELKRVAQAGGAGRAGWAPGPTGAQCAQSRGLPFKVTVLGLRLLWGGGGQGAGPALRRSSPAPFDAGWPPPLGFPSPVFFFFSSCSLSLFFPLTPADSFSRQRHNHGYLIRPYFLIAIGRWGEKQPGCRPRLEGEGKGGGESRQESKLTLPPPGDRGRPHHHLALARPSTPPPPPPNPSLPTTFVCLTLKH